MKQIKILFTIAITTLLILSCKAQSQPVAVPMPVPIHFPGRLIFSPAHLTDGSRKDFLELKQGDPSVDFVTYQTSLSNHPWNEYIPSPTGEFIFVYDGETDSNFVLTTRDWSVFPQGSHATRQAYFSLDEKFLAIGGKTLVIQPLRSQSETELTDSKCATYQTSNGAKSYCVGVGQARWDHDQHIIFEHDEGLFDDTFTFPETVTAGGFLGLGALRVVNFDGALVSTMQFPYYLINVAGETVLGAELSGGFIGFSDTKYAWFDRQAILQGRVEPHPIQAPDGFDGSAALSPDGEFLFMSPNHLISLRNESVSYEFSSSESGRTESCLWHPSGEYVACVYADGGKPGEKKIQIYSITDKSAQSFIPSWILFKLIAWTDQ